MVSVFPPLYLILCSLTLSVVYVCPLLVVVLPLPVLLQLVQAPVQVGMNWL